MSSTPVASSSSLGKQDAQTSVKKSLSGKKDATTSVKKSLPKIAHLPTCASFGGLACNCGAKGNSGWIAQAVFDSLDELSVFDILNILCRCYFITREKLTEQVVEASKDAHSFFNWVVLKQDCHSKVVSKALWVISDGEQLSAVSVLRVKKTLFVAQHIAQHTGDLVSPCIREPSVGNNPSE